MNLGSQQLIHIGAEIVVIGGITYYLNNKIAQNTEVITILAREIDALKQIVHTQSHYIRQLIGDKNIPPPPVRETSDQASAQASAQPSGQSVQPSGQQPVQPSAQPSGQLVQSSTQPPSVQPSGHRPPSEGLVPTKPVKTVQPFTEDELMDELGSELAELDGGVDDEDVDEDAEEDAMVEYPATMGTLDIDLNRGHSSDRIPNRPQRRSRSNQLSRNARPKRG